MKCVFSVKTSPTIVVSVAIKVRGRSRTLSDILRVFILRRIPFLVTYVAFPVKPEELIKDMSDRIIKVNSFFKESGVFLSAFFSFSRLFFTRAQGFLINHFIKKPWAKSEQGKKKQN